MTEPLTGPTGPRVPRRLALLPLLCIAIVACAACMQAEPQAAPRASSELLSTAAPPQPTLAHLWAGQAHFVVDVLDTDLPMGESDTVILADGTLRSYVHASAPSLGVVDQCGDPVPFPGCVIIFESTDGRRFAPLSGDPDPLQCQIPCRQCPCTPPHDHIDQQQYPRVVAWDSAAEGASGAARAWLMVYEFRANSMLRRSHDGLAWSTAKEAPLTGIWRNWLMACRPEEAIGSHPHSPPQYDCLTGSPPGLFVDATPQGPEIFLFVGLGQNPSAMGCYRGPLDGPAALLRKCDHNPLFAGNPTYGPDALTGHAANSAFDFRTISSAEVLRVGTEVYMLYEGVRGPHAGDAGDTQFGLGLARSTTGAVDAPWERYSGNPLLVDLPGNVGVGHADLVVLDGVTYLYTSLDGTVRSRLRLAWRE